MSLRASPDSHWIAFSNRHKTIHEDIVRSIERFKEGDVIDPRAIVGPYGSGKTQLLFHIFDLSWKVGIPALYVSRASRIIEGFSTSNEKNIVTWIRKKASDQLNALKEKEVQKIEWLPPFREKSTKIVNYSNILKKTDVNGFVLLVDELEQAYDKFLQNLPTADKNPLRLILDELQDSLMFWSFGLLSAYEFIGGADIRRFKELRLPPVKTSDVVKIADCKNIPSNFIWWFSQGRIGWINKLIEEMETYDDLCVWLNDSLAEYRDGDLRLINPIWRTMLKAEESQSGMLALMFTPESLDKWLCEDDRSVTTQIASNILLDISKERMSLKEDEIKILGDRLECLLDGFAMGPERRLPISLFLETEFKVIFELLSDHVVAFEPDTNPRDELLKGLRQVNVSGICASFLSEAFLRAEEIKAHSLKPTILRLAFPAPVVNPDYLTPTDTEELAEAIFEPIMIECEALESFSGQLQIMISMCPTRACQKRAIDLLERDISRLSHLSQLEVLLVPPGQSIGLGKNLEVLNALGKIKMIEFESKRLSDFILKLREYCIERDFAGNVISPAILEEVKSREIRREVIRTIDELWAQLNMWIRNICVELAQKYQRMFYHGNNFLWRNAEFERRNLFWTSGNFHPAIVGLSFCPVVMYPNLSGSEKWLSLPNFLLSAFKNDMISRTNFRFSEFLDNLFTEAGVSTSVNSTKRSLDIAKTNRALSNLRSLLKFLIERAGLTSIEADLLRPDRRDEEIVVLKDCLPGGNWANGFLRALMLDIAAQNNYEDVRRRLNELVRSLQEYESGVAAAITRVSNYNDYLKPPDEINVEYVQINDQFLVNYQGNVTGVRESIQALIEDIEHNPDRRVLGQVFYVVVSQYERLLETLDELESRTDIFRELLIFEEVKVAFRRSNEETKALPDHIWELSSISREALLSSVESWTKELFDARGLVGGNVIGIQTGRENSEKLVRSAEATKSKLEILRAQIAEAQESFDTLKSKVESIKSSAKELVDAIVEGGT